jgi:hypothetical protein
MKIVMEIYVCGSDKEVMHFLNKKECSKFLIEKFNAMASITAGEIHGNCLKP